MRFFLICPLFLLTILRSAGQTLLHSAPETRDFDRSRFHVLTRKENRLIVYKATYFNSVASTGALQFTSGPGGTIIASDICVYDSLLQQTSEVRLPLPKEVAGTSFLVYEDFFYLFYQYLRDHTVYCMAVKVDLTGQFAGSPVCLDSTYSTNFNYQSQIYSIVNSEDKQKIMVFKMNGSPITGTILGTALFDNRLKPIHRSNYGIGMKGAEYLSEFHLDNRGNFVFIGLSHSLSSDKAETAGLFTVRPDSDSLDYSTVVAGKVYLDDIHLLVDNARNRYILSSFFSQEPLGNVEGLFVQLRDALAGKPTRTVFTALSDSLRQTVGKHHTLRKVFNNYYVQDMRLLADGDFTLEAQELVKAPEGYYNRWNNLDFRVYRTGSSVLFYDGWEKEHYWPWSDWRVVDFPGLLTSSIGFSSEAGLVARIGADGMVKWMNTIRIPQSDIRHNRLGYTSMVVDDRLYFIYNENIRSKHFLSGQCIDSRGDLNTDNRFKEDRALEGQREGYTYYPRFGESVDKGEIIFPCQKGREVSLVSLRF